MRPGRRWPLFGFDITDRNQPADENFRILDLKTGKQRLLLSRKERFIDGIWELVPDGKHLVACRPNRVVAVSDLETAQDVKSIMIDLARRFRCLACSPDGETIVIATNDRMYFWEWKGMKEPQAVALDPPFIRTVEISPDGTLLAEVRAESGDVVIRDMRTRAVLYTLLNREHEATTAVTFAPAGRLIAAGRAAPDMQGHVQIWNLERRAVESTLGDVPQWYSQQRIAVSADGNWLAVDGWQSRIGVWNLTTGDPVGADVVGHDGWIQAIDFAPDGTAVATAGSDGTLRIWDARTGSQRLKVSYAAMVRGVAFSPDGRLVAASIFDDTVRVLETATGRELQRFRGHNSSSNSVGPLLFSSDGQFLVSWGNDCRAQVVDVRTGKVVSERLVHPEGFRVARRDEVMDPSQPQIDSGVLSPDGRRLAMRHATFLTLLDLATGKELARSAAEQGSILPPGMTFTPDGLRLVTMTEVHPNVGAQPRPTFQGSLLLVRDAESQNELLRIELPGVTPGPIAVSGDGRRLATVTRSDRKLRVFDLTTGRERSVISETDGNPSSLAFSRDGRRIAGAFADGTALIWELPVAD